MNAPFQAGFIESVSRSINKEIEQRKRLALSKYTVEQLEQHPDKKMALASFMEVLDEKKVQLHEACTSIFGLLKLFK